MGKRCHPRSGEAMPPFGPPTGGSAGPFDVPFDVPWESMTLFSLQEKLRLPSVEFPFMMHL